MMQNTTPESVEIKFPLRGPARPTRPADAGEAPALTGRLPRIAQVVALAILFEEMVRSGEARDYADLARLGGVSRERISQIMKLRWLASDIQRALLSGTGPKQTTESQARQIARPLSWAVQRQ